MLELAQEADHPLPAGDEAALGRWFRDAADSGSLVRYLETFDHTIAVMQSSANLQRVAREFVEDLAATAWSTARHAGRPSSTPPAG